MSGLMITSGLEMKSSLLIGITGKARSGKDTFAEMLERELDEALGVLSLTSVASFADPIKDMLYGGLDLEDKDPEAEEVYGKSYRYLAQALGTEWGREMIDPDIWVRAFHAQYKDDTNPIILTDVRFENEARFIRDRVGVIVHMERPDQEIIAESGHKSEAGLKRFFDARDFIISNHAGLEELSAEAKALAAEILPFLK